MDLAEIIQRSLRPPAVAGEAKQRVSAYDFWQHYFVKTRPMTSYNLLMWLHWTHMCTCLTCLVHKTALLPPAVPGNSAIYINNAVTFRSDTRLHSQLLVCRQ